MKVDNIIIAKLSCDDNILKASKKFGANEIKEVVAAALIFTPFEVENVELLKARVSEKSWDILPVFSGNTLFWLYAI